MTIVGFEIVNMEEGDIQAVKCKSLKGGLTIQNAVRTSFNKPLFKVGQKEICGFLKQNGMSHKNILLILPSNVYKSQIWAAESDDKPIARDIIEKMQAYIQDNKSNLDIDKSVSVKKSFSGFEGSKSYGIITIVPHTILNSFYELFHNFNIKYVFPAITAYSILNCCPTENYSGFLDLKETLLTFAVYHKGILIWISDFLYSDTYEYKNTHNKVNLAMVNETAMRAINAAQGNRLYVSRIFLSGIIADTSGIELAMSELLETKCSLYTHEHDGIAVDSEISTLVGVIRGALYPK